MRHFSLPLLLVCLLCGTASSARAQDLADLPTGANLPSAGRAGVGQVPPYWSGSGPRRSFFAASFDTAGFRYRTTAMVGYGRPYWQWTGAEMYATIGINGGRAYAGLSAVWPGFTARVGARYEFHASRHFMPIKTRYDRFDLETEQGPRSRYVAGEAQLTANLPVAGGNIFAVANGYYLTAIPGGYNVFEETLRVVAAPKLMWRGRGGYFANFGYGDTFRIGAAVEVIGMSPRNVAVLRTGPVLSVSITHHLEATGTAMIVVASPDSLGLSGADFGQIALSYRWATGDRFAEFP